MADPSNTWVSDGQNADPTAAGGAAPQTFSWASAEDALGGLVGGFTKGLGILGAASVAKANADAQNITRAAQNQVRRSQAGLAAAVKSINNQRLMENAGKVLDTQTTNLTRTQDAITRGDFEASIRHAETSGNSAARAAALGIGGASIVAASQVADLTAARADQQREEQGHQVTYDQLQAMTGTVSNALLRTDTSPITLGQDFSVNQAPGGAGQGMAGALLQGLLSKKDSISVALGSIDGPDKPQPISSSISYLDATDAAKASFQFEGATTSPVNLSNPSGIDLGPLPGYQDRSDRLLSNAQLGKV